MVEWFTSLVEWMTLDHFLSSLGVLFIIVLSVGVAALVVLAVLAFLSLLT